MSKYIWLVKCDTCKVAIRLERKTEAKNAFKLHLKTCFDCLPPELVEAPFIG